MTALFARLFRRRERTAAVAADRLLALKAQERAAASDSHIRQMEKLRDELVAVIARHIGKRVA